MSHSFPAKVMLLGEYTVLNGGIAYAVPFPKFSGSWTTNSYKWEPPFDLELFLEHLYQFDWLDVTKLLQGLKDNLAFNCTIPMGQGLGSSGAFTAAIYDAYVTEKKADLNTLQNRLSAIESFFHGASSGLDPLVSYLNRPILIDQNKQSIQVVQSSINTPFYIWNSGIKRSTKKLVEWYQQELLNTDSSKQIACHVRSILLLDNKDELATLNEISEIQFNHFRPMITENVYDLWQKSLNDLSYGFKLCGAGGGGYYLAYGKPPKSICGSLIKI